MQQASGRGGEMRRVPKRPGPAPRPQMQAIRRGSKETLFTAAVKGPLFHRGKGAWLFQTANLLPPPTQNFLRKRKPNAERINPTFTATRLHIFSWPFAVIQRHTNQKVN